VRTVFVLQGDIDFESAPALAAELLVWHAAQQEQATLWVLDASGVTFIEAAGLRVLEEFRRLVRPQAVVLEQPSAVLRRILELGLSDLTVHPQLRAAGLRRSIDVRAMSQDLLIQNEITRCRAWAAREMALEARRSSAEVVARNQRLRRQVG
jgi:anti-anti-sigma factor